MVFIALPHEVQRQNEKKNKKLSSCVAACRVWVNTPLGYVPIKPAMKIERNQTSDSLLRFHSTRNLRKYKYRSCFCDVIISELITQARAGARAVDLGGQAFVRKGQSSKLSTKATVFKRVSLLIGGGQAC